MYFSFDPATPFLALKAHWQKYKKICTRLFMTAYLSEQKARHS